MVLQLRQQSTSNLPPQELKMLLKESEIKTHNSGNVCNECYVSHSFTGTSTNRYLFQQKQWHTVSTSQRI
jgi:hypothetical protein